MSDYDRGAYTPQSDAPLAFDARRTSGGGRPMPVTLIISAIILVVLVAALFFVRDGVFKGEEGPPKTVGEPVAETKGPPEPTDAKPLEPAPGLQVYADGEPLPQPTLAPPPEQPMTRPVEPILRPAQPAAPAAPTAPIAVAPKTAPVPLAPAAAPKAPVAPPAPIAKATPPAAKTIVTPPPSSASMVQIGAFSSSQLADAGWNRVAGQLPGEMVGKTKRVEPLERDGQTLYRALVGGFGSRAEADAFCASLKAKGGACTVRN